MIYERKQILIVDDAPVTRIVLKRYLEDTYDIRLATGPYEALDMMKESLPDLIILDIMMPEMNGFELCQKIKEDAQFPFIPIIIVSALEDHDSRVEGMESGADEFIIKPVDRFELNMRVKTLLKIKSLYDQLEISEKRFRAIFENAGSGIMLLNREGERLEINEKAVSLLGYTKEELKEHPLHQQGSYNNKTIEEKFNAVLKGKIEEFESEMPFETKAGNEIWAQFSLSPIKDKEGNVNLLISMINDISELKNVHSRLESYAQFLGNLIEAIPMPMYVKNSSSEIIECNKRFLEFVGKSKEEIMNNKIDFLFQDDHYHFIRKKEKELLKHGGHYEFEMQAKNANGDVRDCAFYKETFTDKGKIDGLICVMVDITERKNLEKRLKKANEILHRQAVTDGLTELYNHKKILSLLENEIKRAERYKKPLSVIMFDIDHFKKVNDSYGHQTGDIVLKAISKSIRENLREIDLAGRYGGEEFFIILPETQKEDGIKAAKRMSQAISSLDFKEGFHVTVSGGVQDWSGQSSIQLIKEVDNLLYTAKKNGRNRVEAG